MSATAAPPTTSVDDRSEPDPPFPETRRRRRVLVVAVVTGALIAALAAWWFFIRSDDSSQSVAAEPQVVEVSTGTFGEVVSADGSVAAAETEDLAFASAGTVTEVNVSAGNTVTAGQVLAKIDSAELESALADAEADLADAEAALDDAQDTGASDEQVDAYDAAVTTAQDAVDSARENLDGAQLVASFDGLVTTVDLTVGEELGSSGVGGTTVTGSQSGSGQTSSQLGSGSTAAAIPGGTGAESDSTSTAGSSEPQIQIVSQGRFVVELGVDTADIQKVEVGQDVDLTISTDSSSAGGQFPGLPGGGGFPGGGFPGGGGGFPGGQQDQASGEDDSESAADITATGTVTEVSAVADASSGVATYTVTVSFTDDSGEVWAGSSATAEINVSARTDVVQVSSNAITTEDGTSTVTVAIDGTVDGATEVREVTTGETQGAMTEIVSGVEPGEMVLIEGRSFGGGAGFPGGGQIPDGFSPPDGFEAPSGAGFPTGNEGGS